MLVPSIFSDNFFDDFFEFPFIDDRAEKNAERKLYGHHAANLMKTDIKEFDDKYEVEIEMCIRDRDMPGRTFFANFLLFTMIFNGGMIPTYLVMKNLGLTNNLLGVVLLPAINIYNLVLMRNFFEGIPQSLFEAATLDGCTPMATFIKVVLPLSKAALASIGLMFAVAYWNDYTNYKLYITDSSLYNFQMKLRSIMMGSDLPQANGGATENTVKSAAIIIAILPFMILYPFLQKYFVKGVNVGAVKG